MPGNRKNPMLEQVKIYLHPKQKDALIRLAFLENKKLAPYVREKLEMIIKEETK